MGILKRIKDITASEVNGWLDQLENPIQMLSHYEREMEEEINKGKLAMSNQIYLEKRQKALIREVEEVIAKRVRQAKLAIQQGEEKVASLAIQDKLMQEKKGKLYEEQLQAMRQQTTLLLEKLNELNAKYDELKHKRLLLISRANVAHSIQQIQHKVGSLDMNHIGKGLARAEERILMLEAQAEVHHHISPVRPFLTEDPSMQEEVEKELAKLKASE